MKHAEWWRFERKYSPGQWIETRWKCKHHADKASEHILKDDPSIVCLHRAQTKPDGA